MCFCVCTPFFYSLYKTDSVEKNDGTWQSISFLEDRYYVQAAKKKKKGKLFLIYKQGVDLSQNTKGGTLYT